MGATEGGERAYRSLIRLDADASVAGWPIGCSRMRGRTRRRVSTVWSSKRVEGVKKILDVNTYRR